MPEKNDVYLFTVRSFVNSMLYSRELLLLSILVSKDFDATFCA
jgi:hypothetical protein